MEVKILLKDRRKDANISQKRLSELTGIKQQKLSAYEHDRIYPSIPSLCKIAVALKLPPGDLIKCE
jgi:transcriptional regulator with XRE-family HTH domain